MKDRLWERLLGFLLSRYEIPLWKQSLVNYDRKALSRALGNVVSRIAVWGCKPEPHKFLISFNISLIADFRPAVRPS